MRAIDADRLLSERMKSKYYHLPNGDIAIPIIDIENAPTIEPERKTGRWEMLQIQINPPVYKLYCSECNYENGRHYQYNFCPNCGADMRGE